MKKAILSFFFLIFFAFVAAFVWQPLSFIDYKNYFVVTWVDGFRYKTSEDIGYFEKNLCKEDQSCICVFFVHGLGDQAVTWRKVMSLQKRLSMPSKMIAIDLPGVGASKPLEKTEDYQVKLLANRLHEVVQQACEDEETILVGNSFGGWITSWMVEQKPERYSKNILLNPAGLNLSYDHIIEGLIDPTPEDIMQSFRLSHTFGARNQTIPWFVARHASARMRHFFPVENMIKAQQYGDQFVDGIVKKIEDKTKLIWGLQDEFLGAPHLEKYQTILGARRVTTLENCAHVPHDQCPDRVVDIINSFL